VFASFKIISGAKDLNWTQHGFSFQPTERTVRPGELALLLAAGAERLAEGGERTRPLSVRACTERRRWRSLARAVWYILRLHRREGGGRVQVELEYSTHTCAEFYSYHGRVGQQVCSVRSPRHTSS
jgi:hypothetical protein